MSKVDLDIRAFIALVTVAMAIAFGIGVAYGPSEFVKSGKHQTSSAPRIQMPKRSRTKHLGIIGDKISDLNEVHVNFEKPVLEEFGNAGHVSTNVSTIRSVTQPPEKGESLPAGQHLMVDISNVEAAFLNSESRLADAMVESVLSSGFTMLSYHCHSLLPAGVSCVGVLRESHISFHTWPDEGVITLDMYTCGPKQLLPAIKVLERLFGIPRKKPNSDEYEEIEMQWSHELRGFRTEEDGKTNYLHKSDLATWVVGPLFGKKKEVLSKQTKHHQVDIWDVWEVEAKPTHYDAIAAGLAKGDPRWKDDSDIITPRRNLFLNGVYQVCSYFLTCNFIPLFLFTNIFLQIIRPTITLPSNSLKHWCNLPCLPILVQRMLLLLAEAMVLLSGRS
jgi:S-adenosylmethionine decarboxylase proenzyme